MERAVLLLLRPVLCPVEGRDTPLSLSLSLSLSDRAVRGVEGLSIPLLPARLPLLGLQTAMVPTIQSGPRINTTM